jgi:hypothetical protein
MEPVLALSGAGLLVGIPSWLVLHSAIARSHRERLRLSQFIVQTSIILGLLWVGGWLVLSEMADMLLWAPMATIPVTAPLAVFLGSLLVKPVETRDDRGQLEHGYSLYAYKCGAAAVAVGGFLPQFAAVMYQVFPLV